MYKPDPRRVLPRSQGLSGGRRICALGAAARADRRGSREAFERGLDAVDGGDLAKVEPRGLLRVARDALRLVDELDGVFVPVAREARAGVLDKADAEKAVYGLHGRGEDADVGQHAAEEDAPHAACSQLGLELGRGKGAKGPLVHDDFPRHGGDGGKQLVAGVSHADEVAADGRAVAVRPRVRHREPRFARRGEEPRRVGHGGGDGLELLRVVELGKTAVCRIDKVRLQVDAHDGRVVLAHAKEPVVVALDVHVAFISAGQGLAYR
mmetsp:Transcript_8174/g.28767  ORF Transcript_8174/g.28767 Transcript_8174/m.28767 type:complete len:266 (+) Transcript_8174:42-839(+)